MSKLRKLRRRPREFDVPKLHLVAPWAFRGTNPAERVIRGVKDILDRHEATNVKAAVLASCSVEKVLLVNLLNNVHNTNIVNYLKYRNHVANRKDQGIWPNCKLGNFYRITHVSPRAIVVNAPAILVPSTQAASGQFLYWKDDKSVVIPKPGNSSFSNQELVASDRGVGAIRFSTGFMPHRLIVDKGEVDTIYDTRNLPLVISSALHIIRFKNFKFSMDQKLGIDITTPRSNPTELKGSLQLPDGLRNERSQDYYFEGYPVPRYMRLQKRGNKYILHITEHSSATCRCSEDEAEMLSIEGASYDKEVFKALRKTCFLRGNTTYTISKTLGDKILSNVFRYAKFLGNSIMPLEEDKKAVSLLNQYAKLRRLQSRNRRSVNAVWSTVTNRGASRVLVATTDKKASTKTERVEVRSKRKRLQKEIMAKYGPYFVEGVQSPLASLFTFD